MLKKHRKFCRCGFNHLDATLIIQKSSRYLWDTLYIPPVNLVGTCLCFILWQRFLVCFWFGFEFDVNLNFLGFLHSGLYFRFMLSMQSFMISWKLVKLVLYLLYPG
jgi:hypothetical protein